MSSNAIFPPGCSDVARADVAPARSPLWSRQETGLTVWFTGLSGAGKTTLANAVAQRLRKTDVATVLLDADVLRQGFCAGLGFSREDRAENVRRISELARRLSASGAVVLVAAIAPYRDTRLAARNRIGQFIEVYVNAPLATCIERDPKGLYARAIAGEISHFTGISDPYEAPLTPDIECRTDIQSVADCAAIVLAAVRHMKAQYVATGVAG